MASKTEPDTRSAPPRPRPAATPDTRWWWEAIAEQRLVIQRCDGCGELRHPPRPCCPHCRSLEWSSVAASGRGEVYSCTVLHHPQLPGFDYPLAAAVVRLAEGTFLVANVVGVPAERVAIGQSGTVECFDAGEGNWLPRFRVTDEVRSPAEEAS